MNDETPSIKTEWVDAIPPVINGVEVDRNARPIEEPLEAKLEDGE